MQWSLLYNKKLAALHSDHGTLTQYIFFPLEYARNFQSIDENMSTTNDIPYDYDSIMHYDAYAFSRNDQPTIRPLDNTVILERLGQRTRLSEKDLNHIRELYCQGIVVSVSFPYHVGSFPSFNVARETPHTGLSYMIQLLI